MTRPPSSMRVLVTFTVLFSATIWVLLHFEVRYPFAWFGLVWLAGLVFVLERNSRC